jgi:pSer/pThr/pTyr-binding forkhead associated (FHA) protein
MRLIFKDENGKPRIELVEKDKFIIGRHSECDLCLRLSGLSRKHLQIERFGTVFVVSDLGSSNGTTLNGKKLEEPAALKNGDVLNCAGVFEMRVEITEDFADAGNGKENNDATKENVSQADSVEQISESFESEEKRNEQSSILSVFVLAPVLGLFVLAIVGILFIFAGEEKKSSVDAFDRLSRKERNIFSDEQAEGKFDKESASRDASSKEVDRDFETDGKREVTDSNTADVLNQNGSEIDREKLRLEKVERYAILFARQIAFHEANYAFTKRQIEEISSRIDELSSSAALANNLKAVRKNSVQLEQMAKQQGLKPQFFAMVAVAQLGKNQGDVLQKAKEILPLLSELKISLGNELTDDNLLIIAAFEQASRGGDRLAMRKTIEALSNQPGIDARKARTVWFLYEKGKILDSQYEAVLRFLAVGVIAQNPSEFGVKAEPVIFQ